MSTATVTILGTAVLAAMLPLSAQTSLPRTSRDVSTDHVKLRMSLSEPTVAPGGRVSLVLEIEPRRRMHVYAPGATDYRVITLTTAPQPFIRLPPVRYPASDIYFFAPLNEGVPVYQKLFTLRQDVILEDTPQARGAFGSTRQLTLIGTLAYQACDDQICFNPVSVPLSWTVGLRPSTAAPSNR